MKILRLTAENLKKLVAVEITPEGNTVLISGKNGAGKTSVLDAISMALGGGPAARGTSKPIREGQDRAEVVVDLGDLIVTRTWTQGNRSQLRVESKDGASYRSPQAMLDALVGRLSFDPLAFAQQDEKSQLAALLELVDLPFDPEVLAGKRRAIFDRRTEIGRTGQQLKGHLAGLPKPAEDLPAEPVDVAALVAELSAAQRARRERDEAKLYADGTWAAVGRANAQLAELRAAVQRAEEELADRERTHAEALASVPPEDSVPDVDAIEQRLAAADGINQQIRAARERADVQARVDEARSQYDDLTTQLNALDEEKRSAIAAAVMPIDGLAFNDDGVIYNDIPFKQCSSAEQLRIAFAMAAAANPEIRVVRITDGSLLDSDSMRLISQIAEEHDTQVWIEVVDESGKVGVLIEDGAVAAVNGEPVKAS